MRYLLLQTLGIEQILLKYNQTKSRDKKGKLFDKIKHTD